MKVEIDIEDYLSKEDIKDECREAIQQCVYENFRKEADIQRLLTNLSYREVFAMVDDIINDDLEKLIRDKVVKIINELSSYCVFRSAEYGERESKGQKILEEEVTESRSLIKKRVEDIIQNYAFHELDREEIGDVVHECIMDRLFGTDES